MAVKYKPDQYHSVTPYLIVNGAAKAIEFYKKAFGAAEILRMPMPDGKVAHAELKIGDSTIMLADGFPNLGAVDPLTLGSTTVSLMIYVEDVDAQFAQAIAAGAKVFKPLTNQFYGDRSGCLTDPFGHIWTLSTHIEDVSAEEMHQRMEAAMKQRPG